MNKLYEIKIYAILKRVFALIFGYITVCSKSSEGGPMQSVYAKYRELKQSIHDVAASDIQRLVRGFFSRKRVRISPTGSGTRRPSRLTANRTITTRESLKMCAGEYGV